MGVKERTIKFRCTQEEYETLDAEREKANMSMSAFIRNKLLREGNRIILNPELMQTIRDVIYEINKIGVNINQVVASCHSKGFTAVRDIEELKRFLSLVEYRESKIIEIVMGELENGNHKTAETERDKGGK